MKEFLKEVNLIVLGVAVAIVFLLVSCLFSRVSRYIVLTICFVSLIIFAIATIYVSIMEMFE